MSIVLPSLDGHRDGCVPRLLESIEAQTFQDFEVHLVKGVAPQGKAINEGAARAQGDILLIVDDDMSCFYNEVESGTGPKGLVLGAPIYLDHTSAQFKCWMDRLHSYNHTELGAKMFPKGFRAVLAITYGAGNPHHYDAVLQWLCGCVENYLQAEVIERLVMASSSREPLENRTELLARARQAGKRLAGGDA